MRTVALAHPSRGSAATGVTFRSDIRSVLIFAALAAEELKLGCYIYNSSGPRLFFNLFANMLQHSQMNFMNDVIRPQMPVCRGPHGALIPGRAFEPRAPAGQRRQQKLSLFGNKVSVQMRRLNISVGTKLVQWSWICRHAKLQQPRLVPHFDGLRKRSRRKNAMPHSTYSMPGNLGANGIRNSRSKQQFCRRRYLRERHDLTPNSLRWRVHLDRRPHFKRLRLQLRPIFRALERWREQENDGQHCRSSFIQPISRLNRISQHSAERRKRQRKRSGHENTSRPLDQHQDEHTAKQRYGADCNSHAAAKRARLVVAVYQHREQSQAKRQRHIQSPSVGPKHFRAKHGKKETNHKRQYEGYGCCPYYAPRNPPIQHAGLRPRPGFTLGWCRLRSP